MPEPRRRPRGVFPFHALSRLPPRPHGVGGHRARRLLRGRELAELHPHLHLREVRDRRPGEPQGRVPHADRPVDDPVRRPRGARVHLRRDLDRHPPHRALRAPPQHTPVGHLALRALRPVSLRGRPNRHPLRRSAAGLARAPAPDLHPAAIRVPRARRSIRELRVHPPTRRRAADRRHRSGAGG